MGNRCRTIITIFRIHVIDLPRSLNWFFFCLSVPLSPTLPPYFSLPHCSRITFFPELLWIFLTATCNCNRRISIHFFLFLFFYRAIRMRWKKVDRLARLIWAHGHRPDCNQPLDTIHTIPHWPHMGKSKKTHQTIGRPRMVPLQFHTHTHTQTHPISITVSMHAEIIIIDHFHHESWLRRFNTGQKIIVLYCTCNRRWPIEWAIWNARHQTLIAPPWAMSSPYFTHKHFFMIYERNK